MLNVFIVTLQYVDVVLYKESEFKLSQEYLLVGKGGRNLWMTNVRLHELIFLKTWSLNILEP